MQMPILCAHYEIPALTSYLIRNKKSKWKIVNKIAPNSIQSNWLECVIWCSALLPVRQPSHFHFASFRDILWTVSNSVCCVTHNRTIIANRTCFGRIVDAATLLSSAHNYPAMMIKPVCVPAHVVGAWSGSNEIFGKTESEHRQEFSMKIIPI